MSSNLRTEKRSGTPEEVIKPAFDIKSELTRGLVWVSELPEGDTEISIDIYVIREDGSETLWNFGHSMRHPGYETVRLACFAWVRDNNR